MNIDVIILSNTSDLSYYGSTCRTINSLKSSDIENKLHITVVETQSEANFKSNGFVYYGCNTLFPEQAFNYNKFLNIGIENCKSEWILICNNDLIFTKKWLVNMVESIQQNADILSFSPICPWSEMYSELKTTDIIEGYQVSKHICGWCILLNKSVIDKCNLFDEQFEFWCQDDDYAQELQKHGVRHALVPTSKVYHVSNLSHELLGNKKVELTHKQQEKFFKKWENAS